ncbi:MAG: HDOD domain-containing protein [Gammaproteobacteria bacterium]
MNPDFLAKLQNVTNLPTPPAVAANVINLAQSPSVYMGDLAEAITCDASLTAKVMRVANSPMYAQRRQCANLHQALVVLGINAAVTLALGFSLMPILRRSPNQNKHLAYIWKRCVLSAVSARVITKRLKVGNTEEAFLAALLQDIGMMAIDRVVPDFYQACEEFYDNHDQLRAYETQQLGGDHADVGAWLLNHWALPKYLQETVALSHRLDGEHTDPQRQTLIRAVALSGLVADLWLKDGDDAAIFAEMADIAEKSVGMDADTFALVMGEIGTNIPDMAATFKTELVSEQDAQAIVEQAQEALTMRNLISINEVAELGRKTQELNDKANDLQLENQVDPLTKVSNRGHLDEVLNRGFAHAKRFGWTLSIAFIDLDGFKQINDTYGHQAGDSVLRTIASSLSDLVRCTDTVGRFGGDEFVLILPGADEDGAIVVGNRVIKSLNELKHDVSGDETIFSTASIGIATMTESCSFATVAEFLAAADKAVYVAKHRGRNQMASYELESAGNKLAIEA